MVMQPSFPAPSPSASGEMSARVAAFDWASTPLGPMDAWPQALRWTVRLLLASGFPKCLRWGPDLVMVYNDAYIPILGDKHPAALGRPMREVWPEVMRQLQPWHDDILSGRSPGLFQEDMALMLRRRGEGEPMEKALFTFSYSPVPDDQDFDRVGGVLITAIETTHRVATEQALRISEERYALALEAAGSFGTWTFDAKTWTVHSDERFARFHSVEPEAALAGFPVERCTAAIHPDDRAWVEEKLAHATITGGEFAEEYRLVDDHGRARWYFAKAKAYLDANGLPLRLAGAVVDITERKLAERRLIAHEEQLRLAVAAGDIGLWDIDLKTDKLHWSTRGKAMFGIFDNRPVSMDDFYAGLHPDDLVRISEAFGRTINPDIRADYDVEFRSVGAQDGIERWIAAKGHAFFDQTDGSALRAVGVMRDITDKRRTEQHLRLMVNELNHRVKNSLASVQAIAAQTFRTAASLDDARDAFTHRLLALARAHDVLTDENWEGAELEDVVEAAANVHDTPSKPRFVIDGPPVRLPPRVALSLSMALHELGTNAAKYGALKSEHGRVHVSWSLEETDRGGQRLVLDWRESGGPPVTPPARKGFGSRLIERGLPAELGGRAEVVFNPGGVSCRIEAPLDFDGGSLAPPSAKDLY